MNSLTNIQENSDEKILWQMMELMMNVGPELFIQSQGIQAGKDILYDYLGIREEIINVIAEEFSDKVSEDEYHSQIQPNLQMIQVIKFYLISEMDIPQSIFFFKN